MNSSLKQQLLEICNRFTTEQLIESIKTHFPDDKTWEQTTFDIYTISDLQHIIPRIFNQLKSVAESEEYQAYPWVHNTNVYGSSDLGTMLNQLLSFISEKRPVGEYLNSINWLLKYLFEFNLWNKPHSNTKSYNYNEKITELTILSEKLKSELARLAEIQVTWQNERATVEVEKNALIQFIEQKKEELRIISDTLATVTNQKNEIENIFNTVGQRDAEIRTTQKNHSDLFEQLKAQKEGQEKEFKAAIDVILADGVRLNEIMSTGDAKIKFFESLDEYIKNKQKEITELGGYAAGRALGGVFGLRERYLNKSLRFWEKAVPGITIVAIIWMGIVFTCFRDVSSEAWVNLLINIARSIPVFILMGFVFRQYSKERNLQEEYAFKAAIAQTIKAYSDLMKNEDTKENVSKQQMLRDAVAQVQTPPKLHTESGGKLFSFRTKDINETLKNLNETLKSAKQH